MRTTVTIDDQLLERVKERARDDGMTLGSIVEMSLRRYLALPEPDTAPVLPTFRGGGVRPGVDYASNASMFAAVDAERDAEASRLAR